MKSGLMIRRFEKWIRRDDRPLVDRVDACRRGWPFSVQSPPLASPASYYLYFSFLTIPPHFPTSKLPLPLTPLPLLLLPPPFRFPRAIHVVPVGRTHKCQVLQFLYHRNRCVIDAGLQNQTNLKHRQFFHDSLPGRGIPTD